MTTFEFFKAQLDEAVEKGLTNRINPEISLLSALRPTCMGCTGRLWKLLASFGLS